MSSPSEENEWEGYEPKHPYRQKPPIDHGPQVHKVEDLLPKVAVGAAARPKQWSYRSRHQPTRRVPQISNGACVGFATAYLLEAMLLGRGDSTDPTGHLSMIMPWNGAKQIEGDLGQNIGVYPHDALTYTRNQGICALDLLPQTETSVDWGAMPGATALENAASRVGLSFAQANSFDELVQAAATLDLPVMYAIAVYPAFENPTRDGRSGNGQLYTGQILGYHDLALVEYDESNPDQQFWTYTVQNWWQGITDDDAWVLTRAQALQVWSEGWVVQLWPQKQQPAQHFVPSGVAKDFWNYLIAGGSAQLALDSGWGAWFHAKGVA